MHRFYACGESEEFYRLNVLVLTHNCIWFQAGAGCGGVLYSLAHTRIISRDVGVEELCASAGGFITADRPEIAELSDG